MKKTYTYAIAKEHSLECGLRRTLYSTIVVAVLVYMFLISLSVVHVVARKEANTQAVATASRIADLEAQLFASSKEIGESQASAQGLQAVEDKHFVTRTQVLGRADVY